MCVVGCVNSPPRPVIGIAQPRTHFIVHLCTYVEFSSSANRPPVGDLRFAMTEPLTGRWEGIRQATEFGNRCPQECARLLSLIESPFIQADDSTRFLNSLSQTYSLGPLKRVSGDEDCLYLNVYVPEARIHDARFQKVSWERS